MTGRREKPTKPQIAAFERGEQKLWRCPDCGNEVEVLSAAMVFCGPCRDDRQRLVPMRKVEELTKLRWHRNTDTPAREYDSADGRFNIIWDPAGPKEGEPGGWYLRDGSEWVGIYRLLSEAKAAAQDRSSHEGSLAR